MKPSPNLMNGNLILPHFHVDEIYFSWILTGVINIIKIKLFAPLPPPTSNTLRYTITDTNAMQHNWHRPHSLRNQFADSHQFVGNIPCYIRRGKYAYIQPIKWFLIGVNLRIDNITVATTIIIVILNDDQYCHQRYFCIIIVTLSIILLIMSNRMIFQLLRCNTTAMRYQTTIFVYHLNRISEMSENTKIFQSSE